MFVFFDDKHPLLILTFDNLYVKFRHLVKCFGLCFNTVRATVPPRFFTTFERLKAKYPNYEEHSLHPTTLLLHLNGVYLVLDTFCGPPQRTAFYKCLNDHLDDDVFEVPDREFDHAECTYGVLDENVEFLALSTKKIYFKAVDVARALRCTPSYCINKYVDDNNMVLWKDLKRYLIGKFVCVGFQDKWKHNTIFLKKDGLKQLTLSVTGNMDAYDRFISNVELYDPHNAPSYVPHQNTYTKKQLCADGCVVGRTKSGLDYIIIDTRMYCKLYQILRLYSIRINNSQLESYLVEWRTLRESLPHNNIHWKPNAIMISDAGVFRLLHEANRAEEAEQFYYHMAHWLKRIDNFAGKH
ncbi:ORF85 [Plodia interpunctella granulovirus]|uniref:ORF85 n=1 Tax=Plodia interpunctella granulovirus TaxID=262175 RepID=A0A1L5JH46_9BBAC|nr:ORF85 [Plodia interpunctella granulovirus]APO13969.1 ORF85 [Plodia interpunctella granulovirus]